ncbi:MAG: 5-formyltetrahydrofolate cyclo-ligase [Chlorobi bacterium]|nr:5-formyltetrahydrofolate cyclo-ligase [Chlorobiota bacterium]
MNTTPTTKAEIRAIALKQRDQLTPEERTEKSRYICETLSEDDRFLDARGIHVYLPVQSEVDLKPLISLAWGMGKKVGLMRVQPDSGSHQFEITEDTEYMTGSRGIPEPVNAERFDMDQCDLVFVPLVAADENCNRIGYGKGYYDQFLTQNPRPTIGVAFDLQIFPSIPVDHLDITLDGIVTESRFITPS